MCGIQHEIDLIFYFFFVLVTRQGVSLSSATQHAVHSEYAGKWGKEVSKRQQRVLTFLLWCQVLFCYMRDSVKENVEIFLSFWAKAKRIYYLLYILLYYDFKLFSRALSNRKTLRSHMCVEWWNNRCTSHNQIFVCMRNKIYFKLYKALNKSTYS